MRQLINTVSMNGVVVIGEGEKDNAPMLFNGEQVGDGSGPECDVAVDPIDGTRLTALGMPDAVSVIAVSERGSMYDPSAVFYMEKLVTGPEAADVVDINAPVADNIAAVARAKGGAPSDVTVVVLDRPRHEQLVKEIRETGARIKFITDGDVAGAIMAARERHRHRPDAGHRRHARRASSRRARSSAWAVSSRAGCGRATTPSGARRWTPGTTSTGADHRRPGQVRRRVLRGDRASPRASCMQGVRYRGGVAMTSRW